MDVFCGIDWAEDHHDIALSWTGTASCWPAAGSATTRPGSPRCWTCSPSTATAPTTRSRWRSRRPRGLLVACLRATGRTVYPVNPMAVARYRDRHSVAGPQVRPRRRGRAGERAAHRPGHAHRPLPADTELAQAIAVLARAQQDAVWDRTTAHNKLRSHLREYFPGFLAAFAAARGGITRPEARAILAAAPTPAAAAALTLAQLRALLKKAGRSRGIDTEATRLRDAFRTPQMRQLPLVEQAMGRQTLALLRQLDAACASADDLEQAAVESFNQHPDAGIITSFPGLGPLTGARVLAEIGDDRSRFPDAKGLKAYAGAAPITRASGKTPSVTHRKVKNNRLAAAGYTWAFSALTASPGARAHYDRRRDAGDRHAAAQRNLFGRLPRLPPPLPGHRPALRRSHRLPRHHQTARSSLTAKSHQRSLTTKSHRMSRRQLPTRPGSRHPAPG